MNLEGFVMVTIAMRKRVGVIGIAALFLFLTIPSVQAGAEAEGQIVKTDGKLIKGVIYWNGMDKIYSVKSGQIELTIRLADVKSVSVKEPPEIRSALQQMKDNNLPPAIAALEKIAQDYNMLQWDAIATRWLAEAYVRDGKPGQAVRVCERVAEKRPEAAISSEMAPWYWQALLADNRNSKLDELLKKADTSPLPIAQARANIMHGEILRKDSKNKEALRDGYLRTVVLFKGVRDPAIQDARAEALYKAARCFDDLGLIAPATRMRTTCMSEHANTDWAQRLKAGEQ